MLTKKEVLARVLIAIAVALLIVLAIVLIHKWEQDGFKSPFTDKDIDVALEYGGKKYCYRDDIDTILVMGIDKYEDEITEDSYNNDQRADFLMLLVIDHARDTYSTIQINRDTIAEMNVLGVGGKKVGTVTQQIALAHTYGSGSQDSCRNTVRAVSLLFGGLHIDRYVAMTMDAVGFVNDLVGGVTVTVEDDLTVFDESLAPGAEVTLTGEQALIYVRYRGGLEDSSNLARMKRQQQYLDALYAQLEKFAVDHDDLSTEDASELISYVTSDCSTSELEDLADIFEVYKSEGIAELEGELRLGQNMEFYPDEKSIKELLVRFFCEEKK